MVGNITEPYIRNPREIELDSESKAKGVQILMLSGAPVRVVGKNRFIVSDFHCNLLKQNGIGYKVLSQP
jgi:hypothetical protein